MKDCFRRFLLPSLALLVFAGAFLGSCTDVDDGLGFGLLPDDQELLFSRTSIDGIDAYNALLDSIPVNQKGIMVLGSYQSDGFGHIRSGALSQFVPKEFGLGGEFFGHRPIFDSLVFTMYISEIFGDTTKHQKFYIYPIVKDVPAYYISTDSEGNETDSVKSIKYYNDFDAGKYVDMSNPLFSFVMTGEDKLGVVTKKLKLEDGGKAYIDALMSVDEDIYNNTSNREFHEKYREEIKGIYIVPGTDPVDSPEDAALYVLSPIVYYNQTYYTTVDYTYLTLMFSHFYEDEDEYQKAIDDGTVKEDDEKVVIDGLILKGSSYGLYSFDDYYITYPNTNIIVMNTIADRYSTATRFNYPGDFVDGYDFEKNTLPAEQKFHVQGLLGVSGYLDFGEAFLTQLKALTTVNGEERILNVNQAKLYIWLDDDANKYMDEAPGRLGLYYKYNTDSDVFIPIPDYSYTTEAMGYSIKYGGYLNRTHGYYEMDITSYVRHLANKTADTPHQVWLAPGVLTDQMFLPKQVSLQNPGPDSGGEPDHRRIRVDLTYTLHKKTIDE